MPKPVYIAGVGLTKVDLSGRVFGSVFDLFAEAFEKPLALGLRGIPAMRTETAPSRRGRSFSVTYPGVSDGKGTSPF